MSQDIIINGVTYPAKQQVAFPGSNGTPVVYELPTEPEAVLNGTSHRPPQTKAVFNAIAALQAAVGSPLTAASADGMTDTTKIYVYTGTTTASLTNGHWYYHNGSAWTDGGTYNSTALATDGTLTVSGAAADAKKVGDLSMLMRGDLSGGEDIDSIYAGGVYRKLAATLVTHWPEELADKVSFLVVFPVASSGSISIQMVTDGSTFTCLRYNSSTTHGTFKKLAISDSVTDLDAVSHTIQGVLPASSAVNNGLAPGVYQKNTTSTGLTDWPEELTGPAYVLAQLKSQSATGIQLFANSDDLYFRYFGSSIQPLRRLAQAEKVCTVGPSGCDYTGLIECFEALKNNTKKKTIYVQAGEYDIYQEYLDNDIPVPPAGTQSSSYASYNSYLPYNTDLIGLGNVVLKWAPADSALSSEQLAIWSPLNVRGEFSIENIRVEGKNCRYLVHDDSHNSYRKNRHRYKNCEFVRADAGASTSATFLSCIGMAFADGCVYDFDTCRFLNSAGGAPVYAHDAPQWVSGRNLHSGASVAFRNCAFSATADDAVKLMAGSILDDDDQPLLIEQTVTFAGCRFEGNLRLGKLYAASLQPYRVTLIGCGNVSTVVDAAGSNPYPVKTF